VAFDPTPLRRARNACALTLTTVGAQLGRDASQVSRYENGWAQPDAAVLYVWLDLLKVDPRDVFPGVPS